MRLIPSLFHDSHIVNPRVLIPAIARIAEEDFESTDGEDPEMAGESVTGESDARSNLSNISSDDELSAANNTTLDSVHKSSHSTASQYVFARLHLILYERQS